MSKQKIRARSRRETAKRPGPHEGPAGFAEFLRAVLDSISDPLFVMDEDCRLVLVNDAYCRRAGRPRAELIGMTSPDIAPGCPAAPGTGRAMFASRGEVREDESAAARDAHLPPLMTTWPICRDAGGRHYLVGMMRDAAGREDAEELLLRTTQEWEETFDTLSEAITVHDRNFNIVRANKAAERTLNASLQSIMERKCYETYHGTNEAPCGCGSCEVLKNGTPVVMEIQEPHLGKYLELKALPRFDPERRISGVVHIVRDITDRKKAEAEQKKLHSQLLQAQKMESVGRLAGGIAHDFNNLLSTILGYSELALMNLHSGHPLRDQLQSINEAGERAAALTQQLLAFSRKQVLEMKTVDANQVIRLLAGLLRRVIGEDITLRLGLQAEPAVINADPNQIEQVLMNLSVNARDAMPSGGRLFIESSNVSIDESARLHRPEMPAGGYVMIAVSDTGSGMSREVREKIFEPFFTTKDLGKGTGLGLATVYGIVKQHNGFIYVYSEVGAGTTFKIYLPVSAGAAHLQREKEVPSLAGGTETVMIVDDDRSIRVLAGDILRPLGYRILTAASGEEALKMCASAGNGIDVVLTDVIMPNIHGRDLARRLEEAHPGIRVIFMSGYTDDMIAHHGVLGANVNFIQKPFTPTSLTRKLRSVLDRN